MLHTEESARDLAPDPAGQAELLTRLHRSVPWQAIGDTPLVRIPLARPGAKVTVLAKLEGANLGGSLKDRVALRMVEDGIASGRITARTTIVESSSGNTAVGLAQVCACLGLRFISVVDRRANESTLRLLRCYGAGVDVITVPDANGEYLPGRLARVQEILRREPDAFWTDQYSNRSVLQAHWDGILKEIAAEVPHGPAYLLCPSSTCGTLLACSEFIRQRGWDTRLVAVDVAGSQIFGRRPAVERRLPGMGAAITPPFAREVAPWRISIVTEAECEECCAELAYDYGLLVGASSGGVWSAFTRLVAESGRDGVHVLIFPDRGERYLDTMSWRFGGERG